MWWVSGCKGLSKQNEKRIAVSGETRATQQESGLEASYDHLLTLWTSGVRDYHSMLSDYLTANSIFVAVIGLIVSRESPAISLSLTVLILLLCIFGILLCLQMAI